jgi:hypothetical protein
MIAPTPYWFMRIKAQTGALNVQLGQRQPGGVQVSGRTARPAGCQRCADWICAVAR